MAITFLKWFDVFSTICKKRKLQSAKSAKLKKDAYMQFTNNLQN